VHHFCLRLLWEPALVEMGASGFKTITKAGLTESEFLATARLAVAIRFFARCVSGGQNRLWKRWPCD
jgi:hypothetical protein